jgi:DNA-binding XRE family transcriptional regulator
VGPPVAEFIDQPFHAIKKSFHTRKNLLTKFPIAYYDLPKSINKQKDTNMEPEEIRLELFKIRHKVQQQHIAKKLGVTGSAVTAVIDRRFKSRRIALAISKALKRPVEEVFPEMEFVERRRVA